MLPAERRTRRDLRFLVLAAGAFVCSVWPVLAHPRQPWGEVLSPAGGEALRAGQWADVTWSSLPPRVEEFEILLSIDDGATFVLRLTPQLDPALRSYRWRVPNLPSKRARLQLRVGIDHREIEGPLGSPFEIVAAPGRAAAAAHWRDGELWATDLPQPPSPFQPQGTYLGLPQPQPGEELAAFVTENRGACHPGRLVWAGGLDLSFSRSSDGRPAHDRRPRDLPLRR